MAKLIEKRYAKALYDLGVENSKLLPYSQQLQQIASIFSSEPILFQLFTEPGMSQQEKKEMVKSIFTKICDSEIVSFLYVLIDKSREKSFYDIVRVFQELYRQYLQEEVAYVRSAVEMSNDQIIQLQEVLQERFHKKITMKLKIEPELIAGCSIQVGDTFIDGTFVGKLKNLKEKLKQVQLAKEGV